MRRFLEWTDSFLPWPSWVYALSVTCIIGDNLRWWERAILFCSLWGLADATFERGIR